MIIDFRVRPPYKSFVENMVFYKNRERTGRTARILGMEPAPSMLQGSIELFVAEMEEAGVTLAVVAGRKAIPSWGSISNHDVAELVQRYPGKFIGYAGVDLSTPESMARDMEEGLDQLKLSGVALDPGFTIAGPLYPDDRCIYPVYERCLELGVPVMITASNRAGPDITWGHPIYIDRVANDFPTLPIVVAHGCWPNVLEMVGLGFKHQNLYVMADMYIVNDMPGALEYVRAANCYLQDRFLFASSYPVCPLPGTVRQFTALPFTEVALKKALYDNAARLLKL